MTIGRLGPDSWHLFELKRPWLLVAEGRALRHCVAEYWTRVQTGRCTIWSLRLGSRRRLTIEVRMLRMTVVQVRGLQNRLPDPEELDIVERWARANGLALADPLG